MSSCKDAMITHPTSHAVKKMYEAFPYPGYPLFLGLKWQDGYLSGSLFAARLLRENGIVPALFAHNASIPKILIVGCGEVLPYIIRKHEPWHHTVFNVDLALKNILRARVRLISDLRPSRFICDDINNYLIATKNHYHHIDCFGVLHHLPQPAATLKLLGSKLAPGGTMRLMVYNRKPREWIHHLKRGFQLLGLDPFQQQDLQKTRQLLSLIRINSPVLNEKMDCMGKATIAKSARLVDTFFHAREARIDITRWFQMIGDAGLRVFALADRFGELDDLANPLWQPPTADELELRALDGRYENNLELFVYRPHEQKALLGTSQKFSWQLLLQNLLLHLKSYPTRWFQYNETNSLCRFTRYRLWHNYIECITSEKAAKHFLQQIPLPALKRLSRVGAIFPGQIDSELHASLLSPFSENTTVSPWASARILPCPPLTELISKILHEKNLYSEKRLHQIQLRFNRAQTG